MDARNRHELFTLTDAFLGDEISPVQFRELQQRLRGDSQAAEAFVRYVQLSAALDDYQTEGAGVRLLESVRCNLHTPSPLSAQPQKRRRFGRWWIGIVAAVVGAVATMWPFGVTFQRGAPSLPHDLSAPRQEGVAVLTRVADAVWTRSALIPQVGASLPACRLSLEFGVAQLEFFSGATVVLQGPADFELVDPMKGILHRGKLRGQIPPQAHSFTVCAPQFDVVDLGTDFAMSVSADDQAEVHVLDGQIEIYDGRTRGANATPRLLNGGSGLRIDSAGDMHAIAADVRGFPGSQELIDLAHADSGRSQKRWLDYSGRLRADPACIVYYSFEGHAPWDRLLRDDASRSDFRLNGAIVGCAWTKGRWPEKQALEFKRISDRVRVDIPGEFDSLTLMAWVRLEGLEQRFNSLMLTDGWELGEPHWQLTANGEIHLGIRLQGAQDDSAYYYSSPVLGPKDLGRWIYIATVYDESSRRVSHYVDGQCVSDNRIRQLPGKLRIGNAEIGNWQALSNSRAPIRSLNGRIDEFTLFSRAFTDAEIREVFLAGKPHSSSASQRDAGSD